MKTIENIEINYYKNISKIIDKLLSSTNKKVKYIYLLLFFAWY